MKRLNPVLLTLILLILVPAPTHAQIYDIPPVDGIQIDGKTDDWGDRGFRVELLPDPEGRFLPADDFDARFRLGWNKGGLFLLVEVTDDIAHEHEQLKRLWQEDCVEIFFAEQRGSRNMIQLVLAPGADERFDSLRIKLYDHGAAGSGRGVRTVQASEVNEDGYVIELFFPCDSMGIDPTEGNEFGFQLIATDTDMEPGPVFRAAWYPGIGAHENTELMNLVRFADKASPPVTLHASRRSFMEGCEMTITGAAEEIGSPFEMTVGKGSYKGVLKETQSRAGASKLFNDPQKDGFYPPAKTVVSSREIASFEKILSANVILNRYVWALSPGGPARGIRSRQCACLSVTEPVNKLNKGSIEETRFDVTVDSEGRWLYRSLSSDPPVTRGFNGSEGWIQDGDGVRREDLSGWGVTVWWIDPLGATRFDRYFHDLEVTAPLESEGEGINVIKGNLPGGREIRFVFDGDSGLLKKAGRLEFSDYKRVDGILIPHLVYFENRGNRTSFIIEEVKNNIDMEESMFEIPDPADQFPGIYSGITDERVLPMLKDLPTEHGGMNVPAADGRFLYDLIIEKGYSRGLEIGTSNGYSTLWMGLAMRKTGGKLITIEYERLRGLEAQENFEKAGLDDIIDLRINDAFKEIPAIEGKFDFIFLDAWKPDYIKFLELIRDRVVPGGAIAAHNVIAQERSMRDFLEAIENDPGLETTYIEESSEGISLSIVKK